MQRRLLQPNVPSSGGFLAIPLTLGTGGQGWDQGTTPARKPHLLPAAGMCPGALAPFDTPITQLPEPNPTANPLPFEKQSGSNLQNTAFFTTQLPGQGPHTVPCHPASGWCLAAWEQAAGDNQCCHLAPCTGKPHAALHCSLWLCLRNRRKADDLPDTHMVQLTATSSSWVTFVRTLNSCIRITGRN